MILNFQGKDNARLTNHCVAPGARTAMSYFRPIVKRHNLTEQQWASCVFWRKAHQWIFTIWRIALHFAPKPDRDPHADGTRRFMLRLKPINDQRKLYISLTKEGRPCITALRHRLKKPIGRLNSVYCRENATVNPSVRGIYCLGNSRQEDIPGDNE